MAEEVRHIFGNSTFFYGLLPLLGLLLSACTASLPEQLNPRDSTGSVI